MSLMYLSRQNTARFPLRRKEPNCSSEMSDRRATDSTRSFHRSPPRYADRSTRALNGTFRDERSQSRDSISSEYGTPGSSPTPRSPSSPSIPDIPSSPPPYSDVVSGRVERRTEVKSNQFKNANSMPSPRQSMPSSDSNDGFTTVTRRKVVDKSSKKPFFDTPPRRAVVKISGTMADRVERRVENMDNSWSFLENSAVKKKVRACYSTILPIQKPAIATIQMGADLFLAAPKGYGRSNAWMIPVLDAVINSRPSSGVINCIIVAQTEHKAIEIGAHLNILLPRDQHEKRLISGQWFWKAEKMHEYFQRIRERGAPLLITTAKLLPTFLTDAQASLDLRTIGFALHLKPTYLQADLDQLKFIIFDEYDEILLSESERWMLERRETLTTRTQVILISTEEDTGKNVDLILRKRWFVEVRANRVDEHLPPQHFSCLADTDDAALALLHIIEKGPSPIAVFFNTEETALRMYDWLMDRKIPRVERLCGKGNHELWSQQLIAFRTGKVDVFLVTYDYAKYVDLDTLALDVFFELPEYLDRHGIRVTRNGRMRSGRTITFICPGDLDMLPGLMTSHANRGLPIDSLKGVWENLQDQKNRLSARHSRAVFRVQLHRQLEALDITDEEDEQAVKKARESMRRNNEQVRASICEGRARSMNRK
ncbi:hypothetical protein PRIPAC_79597 [Pristionchus pacificus]|uniref:ATP-dependent RNA helicase n=1 Tax=Pristionchus pacificus TaxID=54126 RepID=A0A2A6BHK7_PRIPA|nr:hypothetical protein PRIPAC_79597 [Pristionchus pacificus]|eukprot:PDM65291.1 helicase [Pristionchus pacificus]